MDKIGSGNLYLQHVCSRTLPLLAGTVSNNNLSIHEPASRQLEAQWHVFYICCRSAARNEKRMEALRECVRMITANAGGCTTPFPFEAAIWLLEEQEELYGGSIPIYKSVRGQLYISG